jgi:hypothetical protein
MEGQMSYDEVAAKVCDMCHGDKKVKHVPCNGTGMIHVPCPELPHKKDVVSCPVCYNNGVVNVPDPNCDGGKVDCPLCGGTGKG